MPYPFTPVQIAAFRTALETLSDAIEQGEKALSDEQYINLMQGVEDRGPVTTKAYDSVKEDTQQPKEVFSFLPWFGKRKKSDKPSSTELSDANKLAEPVKAKQAAKAIPQQFYFESSDTRITSRFLAGLPWSGNSSEDLFKSTAPSLNRTDGQVGSAFVPDFAQEKAESLSQDDRVASRFFSGLPWTSNDLIAVVKTGSLDESDTEIAKPVEVSAISGNLTSAKLFFSDLPWRGGDGLTFQPASAVEPIIEQVEIRSEKTITINVSDSKSFEITEKVIQKKAQLAREYFLSLPWQSGNKKTPDKNTPTFFQEESRPDYRHDEKSIAEESIGAAKDVASKSVNSSANSFFSQIPGDESKRSSLNIHDISSSPFTSARPVQETQPEFSSEGKRVGNYFQSLPWQGGIKINQNPYHKQDSAQIDQEVTGIFALATQSALKASQKIQADETRESNKRMDNYFRSLPWKGNG
jgi:hypothetical protein